LRQSLELDIGPTLIACQRSTTTVVLSGRADLLYKLGRHPEARVEFERAAALTRNTRERDLLLTRAASCKIDPTNR
jgi:predicted RNA polymerase sigma factor